MANPDRTFDLRRSFLQVAFIACALVMTPAAADSLLDGLSRLGGSTPAGEREFLPVEKAFQVTVAAASPQAVVASFDVASGYYLYRDKIHFDLTAADGAALGTPQFPAGVFEDDELFGRVEVYPSPFRVVLPVSTAAQPATPLRITISYQGCAKDGICYPPTQTLAEVTTIGSGMPEVSGLGAAAPGESRSVSDDAITRQLSAGVSLAGLLYFYGLGLLLAFTPCIFPMVPIISGIVVGRGQTVTTARALLVSATYVLCMAATYSVVGVVAGLFGQNLQAYAQSPLVIAAFSALFVVLALSMFGVYSLQMPSALQTRLTRMSHRQRGGTLLGAGAMGALSAIIVGPCVAAPLAGTLAYVSLTGDGLLGGAVLFVLALGMGTPLLLVGASAGRLLPHAGPWMETVQRVLGVCLLAVAIYLLSRVIPGPAALLLWALLLVVSAVYMGAFDAIEPVETGWGRFWKGIALALLTYGITLIVGAAGGASDPLRPLSVWRFAERAEANAGLAFVPIETRQDLRRHLEQALAREQRVMLDFYADWCIECKRMERTTFADAGVQQRLASSLLLKADVTEYDDDDRALLRSLGLIGPPATLFFGRDGAEIRDQRLSGYAAPEEFMRRLDAVQSR